MLIFILNDVQYSKKAVFHFEKVRMVKIAPPRVPITWIPPAKFSIPATGEKFLPTPITAIWITLLFVRSDIRYTSICCLMKT